MTATPVDLLIEPEWIIPIEPAHTVLRDHALVVDQGRIVALLPRQDAEHSYAPRERFHLPGQVLLPGFVNLHTHAAMTLLRGFADDLPLMTWLSEHIWPAEARLLSPAFVRDGTWLACWEMLRGGITCFNDMYFYPEAAAEAVLETGIRAVLGITTLEFPTRYATDADDYLTRGLAARDALQHEPLIGFCLAPHAPYTVSDATFGRIATLAAQLDLPIHLHLHETQGELEESVRQYGVRPIERLERLGLLSPSLIAVHAVHWHPQEIDLLARHNCTIAHCPTANMKLGSGIAPIADLMDAGVRIGLGSDGAASNNRLDMLQEMRHAALLTKATCGDASRLDAHQVLRMATLEGAAALGLDHEIGSLLPGKAADLCAIRLDDWSSLPCFNPASHLIYVAGRENVTHVWVAGKLRLQEGNPVEFNVQSRAQMLCNLWHTTDRPTN